MFRRIEQAAERHHAFQQMRTLTPANTLPVGAISRVGERLRLCCTAMEVAEVTPHTLPMPASAIPPIMGQQAQCAGGLVPSIQLVRKMHAPNEQAGTANNE